MFSMYPEKFSSHNEVIDGKLKHIFWGGLIWFFLIQFQSGLLLD